LSVRDDLAGKKVRCPGCQAILAATAAPESAGLEEVVPSTPPAARRPRRPAPPTEREYDPYERDRPRARRTPPGRQLVLRIIVLVLCLPGAAITGFLGFKAYSNTHDPAQIESVERNRAVVEAADKVIPDNPLLEDARKEVKRFDQLKVVCYFLLAGCLLGLAGGVLALLRWGKIAAPLLILPAVGAAVIAPISAILTSPLLLAGILAIFIKRPPRAAPEFVTQDAW
jgi:hypothetical protein